MAFQYQRRSQESADARANQQGGGFEGFIKDEFRQYAPKTGDNAIRILPRDASEGASHYGEDVWVHYNVGPDKATVICPTKMANAPCPVCEERQRGERRGDEDTQKELRPSRRVLVWLIDRKNEEQGPQVWGMPWTVDRDFGKACRDRETGAYYFPEDPVEGWDIYFDRSGTPPRVDYGGFQLSRKPNSLPEKILDFVSKNPLLDTLRIRNYDEIKRLFEGPGGASARSEAATTAATTAAAPAADSRPALRAVESTPPPAEQQPQEERQVAPVTAVVAPVTREPEPVAPPVVAPPAPVAVQSPAEKARALRERFAAKK